MKRKVCVGIVCAAFLLTPTLGNAQDPITEIIRQGIIKVIKAVDLKIQRLQNGTIWLQNAQKSLENTMSKLKLDEITDWVEKQRKLYDDYFQELWKVKSVILAGHRLKEIGALQARIVSEYKAAYALFKGDKNFTTGEIEHMYKVYSGILQQSLQQLDGMLIIAQSFTTQMNDFNRMKRISDVHDRLVEIFNDLRQFNQQNKMLSLQRAGSKAEVDRLRAYYGLKPMK